jgi:hypothetical protein
MSSTQSRRQVPAWQYRLGPHWLLKLHSVLAQPAAPTPSPPASAHAPAPVASAAAHRSPAPTPLQTLRRRIGGERKLRIMWRA